MYDENIDILYILNVTISTVHLYLLFHNLRSEDNLLGFITIIFFFRMNFYRNYGLQEVFMSHHMRL